MAIAFGTVGVANSGSVSNSTSQAATMPATFSAGDLLICFVGRIQDYVLTSSTPTGWTFLRNIIDSGTAPAAAHVDIYYKIAAGGDSAPTFTTGTATRWLVYIASYSGVDSTTPFLTESGQVESGAGTTTVHSAPALTNTNASAWGIFYYMARQVATPVTSTPGTGLTERADTENGVALTNNGFSELADSNGPVATGSTTYSATSSGGTAIASMWAAFLTPATAATANPRPIQVMRQAAKLSANY